MRRKKVDENQSTMRMRLFDGKKLVARLRAGDFAHAGETEAIDKMFLALNLDPNRKILDIGCGQGGTAAYIQEKGYGQVTGADIEKESIDYAFKKYPGVRFVCSDVSTLSRCLGDEKYDLICAFNSFYAFPDQLSALQELRYIAKEDADLFIFDYVDYDGCTRADAEDVSKIFLPIRVETMADMLSKTGWGPPEMVNLDAEYTLWYHTFLSNLYNKEAEIISEFGESAFEYAKNTYEKLLNSLKEKKLGGCIIKTKAKCFDHVLESNNE